MKVYITLPVTVGLSVSLVAAPLLGEDQPHAEYGADEELKRARANRSDDDKEKAQGAEYFWRAYRHACQKVRDRIKSLAILRGT
jgi:hypothetical protein